LPLNVSGDLRAGLLAAPVSQRGAPCGIVDVLDFPLGPPDGEGFRGPGSFGVYRERYNGIHAGEDWGREGGNSLGVPVYSIGHGTVTYAQPLGWGIDRGVVIVRHVFSDGSTILSFYGHLDPPSVVLKAGDCVARGDEVGKIGKPRGRPHLHFEIRSHMPEQPGPGYWSVDPRLAGWEIPTDYIWDYRVHVAPGVAWTQALTATASTGVGLLDGKTLVAIGERRLVGLDATDGSLSWSRPLSGTLYRSIVDATGKAVYLSSVRGSVQAFDAQGDEVWHIDFERARWPTLMPLPGGGVVVHTGQELIGVSALGRQLGRIDRAAPPFDWALNGERLIFTTAADQPVVHTLDRAGDLRWAAHIGGRPVVVDDRVFVYNPRGLYRLNPATLAADLITPLDPSLVATGFILAAPDGGVIVSHHGARDRRLIMFNADGTLRWDRSVADLDLEAPRLFQGEQGQVYALTTGSDVLQIDIDNGQAWRVFDGGGESEWGNDTWALATDDGRLLFNFQGREVVALDPQLAIEIAVAAK
jgi:outer membrane protein assembly factor BamB